MGGMPRVIPATLVFFSIISFFLYPALQPPVLDIRPHQTLLVLICSYTERTRVRCKLPTIPEHCQSIKLTAAKEHPVRRPLAVQESYVHRELNSKPICVLRVVQSPCSDPVMEKGLVIRIGTIPP
jgi:hypothetical protein